MATRKDTIFEQYLAPIARFLVDENEMRRLHQSIDWQAECDRLTDPNLVYPNYYKSQNFHGIKGGYLTIGAATSYDPVTQLALPPNEAWVRQRVIDAVQGQPLRILDLGCGTGSTTLLLKQAFPNAEVFGLDLSPFMLAVADRKAKQANLNIHWIHGKAEQTKFSDHSFDLVTASLLFHETPTPISKLILQECFRLLQSSGEVVILDGSQKTLRQTEWLTQIFEEPYIRAYAHDSTEAWMGAAGFAAVHTEEFWWIHQITYGIKALSSTDFEDFDEFNGEFAVS
ncbi:MAG: class I SAM-dependent methyltransferase [Plectolyngbya sp. WJT66-NPBG17]|jgi:ubiquinone/menaquinone biosynthesis C-methylase UbiE|nr:class I SAM-dependent methyltransferase [Plectolyngbya sp. WJT66-NPBG17]MBW4523802.1 class I SAM-dependent methyltransferase [Phormidium tanganyikae FI6-MK23]